MTGMSTELFRYEDVRRGIEELRAEFEDAYRPRRPVFHQLIRTPDPGTPLSRPAWDGFVRANSGRLLACPEDWEHWDVAPDGRSCSRFFGTGSRSPLQTFLRLASVGSQLLRDLRGLCAGSGPPEGVRLAVHEWRRCRRWDLDDGYLDWLLAVHDTASSCPTMFLGVDLGNWMYQHPGGASPPDVEELVDIVKDPGDGTGPIPSHPFVESLRGDLFRSSAEAIGLWLDPGDDTIVQAGLWDDDPPIRIPWWDQQPEGEPPAPFAPPTPPPTPCWSSEEGKLFVGDRLIKHFRQPAGNQRSILDAFQEAGWPKRIDDPIPPRAEMDSRGRLSDAVDALNEYHRTPDVLCFHTDGTGEGVTWEIVDGTLDNDG